MRRAITSSDICVRLSCSRVFKLMAWWRLSADNHIWNAARSFIGGYARLGESHLVTSLDLTENKKDIIRSRKKGGERRVKNKVPSHCRHAFEPSLSAFCTNAEKWDQSSKDNVLASNCAWCGQLLIDNISPLSNRLKKEIPWAYCNWSKLLSCKTEDACWGTLPFPLSTTWSPSIRIEGNCVGWLLLRVRWVRSRPFPSSFTGMVTLNQHVDQQYWVSGLRVHARPRCTLVTQKASDDALRVAGRESKRHICMSQNRQKHGRW